VIFIRISSDNLAAEMKNRNPLAFDYLFETYKRPVYSLTYRILNGICSPEDIEECVSDVFVEAWDTVDDYNAEKAEFRTWLFLLAKYKSLDYKRAQSKRRAEIPIDENTADDRSVEDDCLANAGAEHVLRIIDAFGEPDRTIFHLRYFFYESIDRIAMHTGTNSGKSWKRKGANPYE
jgi:RNA polymerase sigma-70 factor (ECF subfamily)